MNSTNVFNTQLIFDKKNDATICETSFLQITFCTLLIPLYVHSNETHIKCIKIK